MISLACSTVMGWVLVRIGSAAVLRKLFSGISDPSANTALSESLGVLIGQELFSVDYLKGKLLKAGNYEKLVPQIEAHIDHFLRVRLKEEMPVVGMMIGDRTISQMKSIFLKELELLFPEVMEGYLENLKGEQNIGDLIVSRLRQKGPRFLPSLLNPFIRKQILHLQLAGAVGGLLIGLIQVTIFYLWGR